MPASNNQERQTPERQLRSAIRSVAFACILLLGYLLMGSADTQASERVGEGVLISFNKRKR